MIALSGNDPDAEDRQLLSAMLMWVWSCTLDAPLDRLVPPEDVPTVELLARQCFDPPLDSATQPAEKPLSAATYRMARQIPDTEPWRSLAAGNTPGALPAEVRVFLAQGGADTTIPPRVTQAYRTTLCRAGSAVRWLFLKDTDHRFIARDAAGEAVAWMADRFAGRPAPDDCGAPN